MEHRHGTSKATTRFHNGQVQIGPMHPVIPQLLTFSDLALLLLRLLVGVIFFSSGLNHVRDPVGRAASIGMSPAFTRVVGWASWRVPWG
jgi:hypothetical protein